jgi:3-phosphoglycerate kinase
MEGKGSAERNVRGVLFRDYIRMMRSQKSIDWSKELDPDDFAYVVWQIEPNGWYPMASFERMGNAILRKLASNDVQAVRMWGRGSVAALVANAPGLLASGDPVETLMRMRVLRATFFDFEALSIPTLVEDHAEIVISYHMGKIAEEAASFQTMGVFEQLLELASAKNVHASFAEQSWTGDPRTLLELSWTNR